MPGKANNMIQLDKKIEELIPPMQGWCTPVKAKRLAQAVFDAKAGLSVELGVFGGRGVISLALAHQFQGHGVAWGFDPWTKEAALEGSNNPENDAWWAGLDLEAIYRGFVNEVYRHDLLARCFWARLRSDQAVTLFENDTIDILHADSNHSERVSCDEVNRWRSKLKPGGLWFADDIDWPTTKKAQELLKRCGFQEIENHTSWAIWQKV